MSSIYDWTTTEGPNANSDNTINWAEFMPPSDVNNSARAMMARLRQMLTDFGGISLSREGSADNAIQVDSSFSEINSYPNGFIIVFRTRTSTTDLFTLNVNGINDVNVYKNTSSGIIRAGAGDISAFGIYECIYNSSLINNEEGWLLMNPSQQSVGSPGQIGTFAVRVAPEGWLACTGNIYLISDYPSLYQAIGRDWTEEGVTDDRFQVPNFKGVFLRGWNDSGTGSPDQNRTWASYQDDLLRSHNHPNSRTDDAGVHSHDFQLSVSYDNGSNALRRSFNSSDYVTYTTSENGNHSHSLNISNDGGVETRPANYPILYCIKT